MRIIQYTLKGVNVNISLNPFKLGTTVIERVGLIEDNTMVVPYRTRLYMLPFITIERWNYKGEVQFEN